MGSDNVKDTKCHILYLLMVNKPIPYELAELNKAFKYTIEKNIVLSHFVAQKA